MKPEKLKEFDLKDTKLKEKAAVKLIRELAVGIIPVVGSSINRVLNHHSSIKQNRINEFSKGLATFLAGYEVDFINSRFEDENFLDLFEAITSKITVSASQSKRKRFQKVLEAAFANPEPNDFTITFLDFIQQLNEHQILFLEFFEFEAKAHAEYINKYNDIEEQIKKLNIDETKDYKRKKELLEKSLEQLKNKFLSSNVPEKFKLGDSDATPLGIERSIYEFLLQDLISKGLILDNGVSGIEKREAYTDISITRIGKEFLKFLKID